MRGKLRRKMRCEPGQSAENEPKSRLKGKKVDSPSEHLGAHRGAGRAEVRRQTYWLRLRRGLVIRLCVVRLGGALAWSCTSFQSAGRTAAGGRTLPLR
jgi:hypothetical protein